MDTGPIIFFFVVLAITGWLTARGRKKMEDYRRRLEREGENVPAPPRSSLTRAQRRVEELRRSLPPIDTPSVEDIARSEAEDLGLNDIPGNEGLSLQVKLVVWHRDEDLATRCGDGLRYQIAEGVDPADAGADDVSLVCDGELADPHAAPDIDIWADAPDAGDDSGNNPAP